MDTFLVDYPESESDSMVDTSEATHITGAKNSGKFGRTISVNVYQWLIVVGALGVLWALRFGLKSDLKVG